jgi:hypothetical protein
MNGTFWAEKRVERILSHELENHFYSGNIDDADVSLGKYGDGATKRTGFEC